MPLGLQGKALRAIRGPRVSDRSNKEPDIDVAVGLAKHQ